MILRNLNLFLVFLLALGTFSNLVCDSKESQDYIIGLCKCNPFMPVVNFDCVECQVNNCTLCSIDNPYSCDICKKGYALDQLSQSICVPAVNSTLTCISQACHCLLLDINIDGQCLECQVDNCLLCSVDNLKECDVCEPSYVLDQLTFSQCVKTFNSTPACTGYQCYCFPYQLNIEGNCVNCAVNNCLLCAPGKPHECDICIQNYVLDQLTQSLCLPVQNSTINCQISPCSCSSFDLMISNTCYSCLVLNCLLCSALNRYECDICKSGFILDYMTKATCVLNYQTEMLCTSLSCKCSPYYSKVNDQCLACNVTNCILCELSNPYQCDVCKVGYVLDQLTGKFCLPKQNEKKVCTTQNNGCLPYQVSISGACASCIVPNCLLCAANNAKECDICKSGYILDKLTQSICLLKQKVNTVCILVSNACENPFQISYNSSCVLCAVSNCQLCSAQSPNQCDICQTGYILDSLSKAKCISKSKSNNSVPVCSASVRQCLCSSYSITFANNSTCSQCLAQNCLLCSVNDSYECDVCKPDFIYNSTLKKCVRPSCLTEGKIWSGNQCICPPSSYLKLDGVCQKCPSFCIQCSLQLACTKCATHYYLSSNYTCLPCIEHCQKCSNTTSICLQCDSGYYYNQSQNKCTNLPLGIQLVASITVKGQQQVLLCPSTCIQCSSAQNCSKCTNGHYLQASKCHPCADVCLTCSQFNSSKCLSCYSCSMLIDKTCVKCNSSNCLSCIHQPSYCVRCTKGHYASSSGICLKCGLHCTQCSTNGFCTSCESRHVLLNGNCVECLVSCSICDPNNISSCLSCSKGFFNSSGICEKCSTGCEQCTNAATCITCNLNYQLQNGLCYNNCQFPCLECVSQSGFTKCTTCFSGFVLNANSSTCLPDFHCTYNSLSCVFCPINSILVDTSCIACEIADDLNCLTCSTDLITCYLCKSGYFLGETNKCQSCNTGCMECQSIQTCNGCQDGYYMLVDEMQNNLGICQECNPIYGCAACLSQSVCLTCISGFYLSSSKCISKENIGVKLTLLYDFQAFTLKIQDFKLAFLNLLADKFTGNDYLISILSLKPGSVIMDLQLTIPPGISPSTTYNSLSQSLQQGTVINGISLAKSPQITANGFIPNVITQPYDKINMGFLLGIFLPLNSIIIVIIFYNRWRKRQQKEMEALQKKHSIHQTHPQKNTTTLHMQQTQNNIEPEQTSNKIVLGKK